MAILLAKRVKIVLLSRGLFVDQAALKINLHLQNFDSTIILLRIELENTIQTDSKLQVYSRCNLFKERNEGDPLNLNVNLN